LVAVLSSTGIVGVYLRADQDEVQRADLTEGGHWAGWAVMVVFVLCETLFTKNQVP